MNLSLFGSGEFTKAVEEIDEYLITTYKPHNIAVLPTAAGAESDSLKWIELAKQHYAKFNLPVIPVPILNKRNANQVELINLLDQADWIFFSGGDPSYLLDVLSGSKLWDKVAVSVRKGVLLSGSSAGAMVMGNFVLKRPLRAMISGSNADWQKGFGLVNYTIIPHFDRLRKHGKIFQRIIENSPEKVRSAWVGIDENTALLMVGSVKSVHGIGTVEIHDSLSPIEL